MITPSEIKLIRSLRDKENRYRLGLFIAEGVKTVDQLLHSEYPVKGIYALKGWFEENQTLYAKNKSICHEITQRDLYRISNQSSPNEVLSIAGLPSRNELPHEPSGKITFILDGINDPGNLGTIIRTADWFGMKHIICSENCVDVFNPKVIQSTMGSCFHVKVFYQKLVDYLAGMKKRQYPPTIIGCTPSGENLPEKYPPPPYLVVLGSESHGISENLLPFINQQFKIPGGGTTQSLNVAVAAGIIAWEFWNS